MEIGMQMVSVGIAIGGIILGAGVTHGLAQAKLKNFGFRIEQLERANKGVQNFVRWYLMVKEQKTVDQTEAILYPEE